ncbi:unnamed protein product [marine sediment metagenome]|uniref:Uncharacterized protein n=1 Tax=marine sediment metagenome TaxID=412755 RepID=X1P0T0_9ZZZZ
MTKEKRINIRISPELERQLTVLQKSLYQSQRYAQDKGMTKEPVKMLSLSQVARIILINNFKRPGAKFKKAEDLSEEEEVEAELVRLGGVDFWTDHKLLDKNLADSEELEEIDSLLQERDRLIKIKEKPGFKETPEHSRKVEELVARIDKINLRIEEEQAKARTAKEKRKR